MMTMAAGSVNASKIAVVQYGRGTNTTYLSKEDLANVLDDQIIGMNFDIVTQVLLILVFAILIVFGATGNGLVCYVVARNPHMRTPRNIFIINLAISDLTLCLFTQPFNLMKVSMRIWKLGNFMCKFVPMSAGTNVFVSTISITAIALDRFQVIVYPTKDNTKKFGAVAALLSIWTISLLMASPMVIFNITQSVELWEGYVLYRVCVENPDLHYERGAYSIASMIFQYFVPIIIVTVAHARICNKLKYRMANQRQQNTQTTTTATAPHSAFFLRKQAAERKRKRKTNLLLIFIAVVFACSWMPLNVFNILADFDHNTYKQLDKKGLVFPICHLLVLSSACTNPVLYGWLNENFRKEFARVFSCCSRNGRIGGNSNRNGERQSGRRLNRNTHQRDEELLSRNDVNYSRATTNLLEYTQNGTAPVNGGLMLDVCNGENNGGCLSVNTSISMTSIN